MATDNPDTGSGATAALTTATWTGSIENIGAIREAVESLDITHLGIVSTNSARMFPGDNPVLQDIPIVSQFKADEASPRVRANQQDTLTITLPSALAANTTPMSVVMTGFVKENDIAPNLQRNQINKQNMVFTPDGSTLTVVVET